MKCVHCGEEMVKQNFPDQRVLFKIPFTDYTVELWNWGAETEICVECSVEEDNEPYRREYEAGHQDGYQEAYEKYSNPYERQ